jgi:methyl-accepting chemotaxis protein
MKTWFNNLKIRGKLLLSFSIVIILLVVVGVIGMFNMHKINEKNKILYGQIAMPIQQIGNLRFSSQNIKIAVRDMIAAKTQAEMDSIETAISGYSAIIGKNTDSLKTEMVSDEELKYFDEYAVVRKDYQKYRKGAMALARANKDEEALYAMQVAARESIRAYDRVLENLLAFKTGYGQKLNEEIKRLETITFIIMALSILLGIAFAALIAAYISNNLSGSVKSLSERVNNLSNVDLANLSQASDKLANGETELKIEMTTEYLKTSSLDEIGMLAQDVNSIITNTKNTASSLDKAVKEISRTIEESNKLVQNAYEGKLDFRSDSSSFNGGYKTLVEGLNKTLNAVATPFEESKDALEKMSKGDFTIRMNGRYRGDYENLKESINLLAGSMTEALGEVALAVQSTASASAEISSSSEQMAAGSQEQSQQTGEVAGAIEQMTRTIIEGAKSTSIAADNSKAASDSAKKGSKKIEETKEGIRKIVTSSNETGKKISLLAAKSDQIGEIAQVIDDIADQTNLLALNAAIEAARAGEQGRGFAVVADEVRKLAERTMKATKEIGETIKSIQEEAKEANKSMELSGKAVEEGMKLTEEVSEALGEILTRTNAVSDVIIQVAASSEEQSTVSEEISRNIAGINSVTQETAQGIEQIARSAEDLSRLTTNLQNLVSRFKFGKNEARQSLLHKVV